MIMERQSWVEEELQDLKDLALDEQLESIFGKDTADRFLNPTIQDKSHRGSTHNITKQSENIGAQDLWHSLRSSSRGKMFQSAKIYDNFSFRSRIDHDNAISRIEGYKHRFELMYHVAQVNEKKTKQLLQQVKLPKITGELKRDGGPEQYNINELLLPNIASKSNMELNRKETDSDFIGTPEPISKEKQLQNYNNRNKNDATAQNDKVISFLSEDNCRFRGQFRNRMKLLGVDSSVGIVKTDHNYKRKETVAHMNIKKQHSEPTVQKKLLSSSSTGSDWQPLTFTALIEYTKCMPSQGEGKFRCGKAPMWKIET